MNQDYFFKEFLPPKPELTPNDIFEDNWLEQFADLLVSSLPISEENRKNKMDFLSGRIKTVHLEPVAPANDLKEEEKQKKIAAEKRRIELLTQSLQLLFKILRGEKVRIDEQLRMLEADIENLENIQNNNVAIEQNEQERIKKRLAETCNRRDITLYDKEKSLDDRRAIYEEIENHLGDCPGGLQIRVNLWLTKLTSPQNLQQLLTRVRIRLLDNVVSYAIELVKRNIKNSNLPTEENAEPIDPVPREEISRIINGLKAQTVHLLNIVTFYAHPLLGVPIISQHDHVTLDGLDDEKKLIEFSLAAVFDKRYQLFSIIYEVIDEIKLILGNQGYYRGYLEKGYKLPAFDGMAKCIAKLFDIEVDYNKLFIVEGDIDEGGKVVDLNVDMLARTIFCTLVKDKALCLDEGEEKVCNTLAAFFQQFERNCLHNNLKSFVVADPEYGSGLPEEKYANFNYNLEKLMPNENNDRAIIHMMEFFYSYLSESDIKELFSGVLLSEEEFCSSVNEMFWACSSHLQGFLLSYQPQKDKNSEHDKTGLLDYVTTYCSLEEIDRYLNKIITFTPEKRREIFAVLHDAHCLNEEDCLEEQPEDKWGIPLVDQLRQFSTENSLFTMEKKQDIYEFLWGLASNPKLGFAEKYIRNIYSSLSLYRNLNAFLAQHQEYDIQLVELTSLQELLKEEEAGYLCQNDFKESIMKMIKEIIQASFFFMDWLIFDKNNRISSEKGQLEKILSEIPLFLNERIDTNPSSLISILNKFENKPHFKQKLMHEMQIINFE
ncbi:MAG: hypothetical protein HKM04_12000, partial [Legionellales bacterium]|nr:hypothetical protein [Legionellales bacterium]